MGTLGFVSQHKKYLIFFLNVSFLLVGSVILLVICFTSSEFLVSSSFDNNQQDCKVLEKLDGYKAKCLYLKSGNRCVSQGYIDYLYLFYCSFGRFPFLGYFLIFLWLLVLFYLLGNTASEYFCSSLESLSRLLDLSPTIAGVTLLSLGNGAPDVFASLVSFMGSGTSDIGLNTVLGAASFVTCVVVGTICICLHKRSVRVNKYAFIRDVCFFLLVLASLVVILIRGKINLWGAIGFSSMYVVYVVIVYLSVICYHISGEESETEESSSYVGDLSVPILTEKRNLEDVTSAETSNCFFCNMIVYILEMPLYLPRRLTIPVVCEKKWSKPIAVTSVTLSPILVAALWNPESLMVSGIGLLTGFALGVLAFLTTEKSSPPKYCLFPWLAGGFLMSMVWSYITAQELVALLVSVGYILGINPSLLGLTVLAWGNSLGDLITNLTMSLNGESQGAQVAISGCYAGPIFNIVFGLGLSLVGSCWRDYPSSMVILEDPFLLETLGFLVGALVWALVVLPWRGMRLDGVLGGGLIVIYLISMSLRFLVHDLK
ncbi:hypothetical protein Pint_20728 [Pistacia integerrima]|uniref:Uncharacterized protein n=1 Tax=Pistacia integerrima TaxID=434235 RepID=A0ACC0XCV3_9ROSI|nr:hypothetical protein Pint_20728 [Pistacia integerrima]